MGTLKDYGIVGKLTSKKVKVFEGLFPGRTFLNIKYGTPKNYVATYRSEFKRQHPNVIKVVTGFIER